MKSKLLVLSAALMLVLCGCQPKGNDFVPDDNPGGDVTPDVVHVTSVSLNQTSATLNIGDTLTLQATVLPENATNKGISWSASNGNVSVDDGLVTALQAGTATVTATSLDGSITASCDITVNAEAVEETINFGEEGSKPVNTWVYWAADAAWNLGGSVVMSTHKKVGNTLTFAYTATGNCDFGFQVFYKRSSLNEGASYRLTANINSQRAGTVKLNGAPVELSVGDNLVEVKYVEGGAAASSFQLVVPTSMGSNTFVINNYEWEGILDIPGAVGVDVANSKISFSAVDGAANYLVKYYTEGKALLDSETVAASGATLTKLPTNNGNYYVSVTAKSSLDPKYDSIESALVLFKIGDDAIVPAGGAKTNMNFGEENNLPLNKFVYWAADAAWNLGGSVTVASGNAYTEEGLVHVQYTATGNCAFGLQIFYKNSELTNGTTYKVSFKMKASVAGSSYHVLNTEINKTLAADTWTDVEYEYTEAANKASLAVIIPSDIAAANTVELKGFTWTAK